MGKVIGTAMVIAIVSSCSIVMTGCNIKNETFVSHSNLEEKKLSVPKNSDPEPLPNYVKYNLNNPKEPKVLRTNASELKFPLTLQDKKDINILVRKFDGEKNIAGLAAPQIGIGKKIIVFAAEPTEELKKWRPDFTDGMPKTVWINPRYEAVGNEKHTDYEGCFSVDNLAGRVPRFKTIKYEAFLENGAKVQGQVSGFLARIIQHEIDHLNSTAFVDLIPKEDQISMDEYRKMREKAALEQ